MTTCRRPARSAFSICDMKRFILALLVLACFAADAEIHCLNTVGDALILDEEYGIISLGEYEKAYPLGYYDLYAAKTDGGWTILDQYGERIGETYQKIGACSAGMIVMKDQKYRLLDEELAFKNNKQYMLIVPLSGGALALKGQSWDSIPDRAYYLDADGTESIRDIRLMFTGEEAEGLVPACDGDTGLWGYIGSEAFWKIAPTLYSAGCFVDGIAPASMLSGIGAINTNGEWLLHPLFTDVRVNSSFIMCRELGALYVYRRDENGLILISAFERAEGELAGDYYVVRSEGEIEIYDAYGTLMLSAEGDAVIYPGLQAELVFERDGRCAAVDIETSNVSEVYDTIRVAAEYDIYLCGIRTGNSMRYGLMNGSFVKLLPAVYDSISVNGEGMAAAQSGDRLELYVISNGGLDLVAAVDTEIED